MKNTILNLAVYELMEKPKHGGSRPNSGRPKLGKKKYLISSLPEHIEEIRRYIKELHKPAN